MSTIPLYDALVKLGLKNKEAREAVDELPLAKDVATKEDLSSLKEDLSSLEARITNKILWAIIGINTIFTGVILGGVGWMIKFLLEYISKAV